MRTLDHNFNEIAASTAKPEAETSKYPPPFSIRLTFEEHARLDADRGRASLAAHIRESAEQFADFRQGALQALDIFDPLGWLADAVSGNDVEFAKLKEGKTTVYLVIPQDKIATHGTWLGLVTRQAITKVARSQGNNEVLFMLDESANMGRLSGLAESLTALPGLGVRVWMFVQELSELIRIYGPHTTRTVLMRLADAQNTKKALTKQLGDVDQQIESLLDRIVEANSAAVVSTYEARMEKLERKKIVL